VLTIGKGELAVDNVGDKAHNRGAISKCNLDRKAFKLISHDDVGGGVVNDNNKKKRG
jgi:hypothetical protein